MLLCLAERVARLAEIRMLRHASGDGQRAAAGETLEPLTVELVDLQGKGLEGQQVKFAVRSGGGRVEPETTTTDAQGLARTKWTLGSAAGLQEIEATAAGSPLPVVFRATAERRRKRG
jgi:hypothetical protein